MDIRVFEPNVFWLVYSVGAAIVGLMTLAVTTRIPNAKTAEEAVAEQKTQLGASLFVLFWPITVPVGIIYVVSFVRKLRNRM